MRKQKLLVASAVATLLFACKQESQVAQKNELIFQTSDVNEQVNACDNLFEHANGKWMKNTKIPSTESRWGSFTTLAKKNQNKIESLLEGILDNAKTKEEKRIQKVYNAFKDSVSIEEKGVAPITKWFKEIQDIGSTIDLLETMTNMYKAGIKVPFGYYIGSDDKNSSQNISFLYQSGLGLPDRDYYFEENYKKAVENYKKYIQDMFTLLGEADPVDMQKDVFFVEEKLAKVSMNKVDRRDPNKTYNKYTTAKFDKSFAKVKWSSMLKQITGQDVKEIVVNQPQFYKEFDNYLHDIPLFRWQIYLKWKVLNEYADWLPIVYASRKFDFYGKQLRGVKQMRSFEERAIRKTNSLLGEGLGKLYVGKYFPESAKKDIEMMVENLRTAFKGRIEKLTWMSDETKKKALLKLSKFKYKIGYPNKWTDYSKLNITSDNPIEIMTTISKFEVQKMVADKLNKPVDKSEWYMSPQTVNAYYSSSFNEIVFPAAILQPPFYDAKGDVALNYGAIGAVIGHEFSHGFDDKGSMYDGDGNLNQWWTEEDRKKFDAKGAKLAEQYSSYEPIPGYKVNGKLTLGENIADLGGLTLAYYALQNYYAQNPSAKKDIDGKKPEDRLFYGWSNAWRVKTTESYLKQQVATDPHSPAQYRVNGTTQNMQEFHDAFNCKPEQAPLSIW